MDQPLKSPGQTALDDAFHRLLELSRTMPAPIWPSGSTGWRGCARRFRRTSAFRAGDLGGFRPSQQDRDHDRRDHAGARRDQARHQASEEMDGAAAGFDRAAIHAGQKPPDPAAARRRRHHRAVELSAAAHAGAGGGRACRRQSRDDQAERAGAAVFRAAQGSDRREIRRHRNDRDRHRGRHRASLCRAAVRSSDVHGLDPHRPPGRGGRRAQPDAGHARAWRQVARDYRPLRRSRRSRRAHRLWQAAQCRPDLHRAGLCAGAGSRGAGFCRPTAGQYAEDVRHRSEQ